MTNNIILFTFSSILLFSILLILLFLYISSIINFIYYKVPQIATYNSDIKRMKLWLKKYNLEWKKIIDLWSGTWKSIRFFEKYFKAKPTWYEIDYTNYFISVILNKIYWLNANIKRSNFLNANLEEYDFIYIYLFPKTMDSISDFIYSTSKKWTIIFVNAFKIKNAIPIEILYNKNWKEEIYIYKV